MAVDETQYGNRIATLETNVEHLSGQMVTIQRQMDDGFKQLGQQLTAQAGRGRITWQGVAMAIGTVISILGVAAVVIGLALKPLQDHMKLPAHHDAAMSAVRDEERLNNLTSELNYHQEEIEELRHEVHNNNTLKQRVAVLETQRTEDRRSIDTVIGSTKVLNDKIHENTRAIDRGH